MKRDASRLHRGIMISDALWAVGAFFLNSYFNGTLDQVLTRRSTVLPALLITAVCWWTICLQCHLEGFRRGWKLSKLVSEVALGGVILGAVLCALSSVLHLLAFRAVLLQYTLLLSAGFLVIRLVVYGSMHAVRPSFTRRIVIVGNGEAARELAVKLQSHPEMRGQVVGFLFPSGEDGESSIPLASGGAIETHDLGVFGLFRERQVTDVIVTSAIDRTAQPVVDLIARCRDCGIRVSVVPQLRNLYTSRPVLLEIGGLPILQLDEMPLRSSTSLIKRVLDLGFVLIFFPFLFAVLGVVICYARFRFGRALDTVVRCGRGGRSFRMFRVFLPRDDHSWFARLLVRLSITELPQFWNVLRGDMSMVGPRPEPPERVEMYSEWQRRRLAVRPGITGLAQVHGLREQHSSEQKSRYDLEYIASWSPFSDCILLVETIWILLRRLGDKHTNTEQQSYVVAASYGD